ncbi:MAG: hypothetical protein SNG10_00430 [Rikenellaceae bacterium]
MLLKKTLTAMRESRYCCYIINIVNLLSSRSANNDHDKTDDACNVYP